jgi:hypothetical protein
MRDDVRDLAADGWHSAKQHGSARSDGEGTHNSSCLPLFCSSSPSLFPPSPLCRSGARTAGWSLVMAGLDPVVAGLDQALAVGSLELVAAEWTRRLRARWWHRAGSIGLARIFFNFLN